MNFIMDITMISMTLIVFVGAFFVFDEVILNGYFATKLRKRFDMESLKTLRSISPAGRSDEQN